MFEYLKKRHYIRFTPVDLAKELKVTNRTVINWCSELAANGYLKPLMVKQRIREYEWIDKER